MELHDKIRSEEGKWVPHSDNTSRCESNESQDGTCSSRGKASESTLDLTQSMPLVSFSLDGLQTSQKLDRKDVHSHSHRQRSSSVPASRKASSPDPENESSSKSLHPPPLWMGCARYFCQPRHGCGDSLQQCDRCKVYVCNDCTNVSPKQCKCQVCSARRYLCPNCMVCDEVVKACRWEEEEAERKRVEEEERIKELEKQAKVKQAWQDAQSERDASDQLAMEVAEFFGALMTC